MYLPPDFDKAIAIEAANLLQQSYDQYSYFESRRSWLLQGKYDAPVLLTAKPSGILQGALEHVEQFGFVTRNKDTGVVFVVYRGTQSPGDWMSNIVLPQVLFKDWGMVEQGFSGLYWQTYADMQKGVFQYPREAKVVVTGHSLGGGLSTLAAADLAANGRDIHLYNFASPRTCDDKFAAIFNGNPHIKAMWRIVNTEDIVTTLPLATSKVSNGFESIGLLKPVLLLLNKFDYTHVGRAVTFTTQKHTIVDNHKMDTYLEALTQQS